MFFNRYRYYNLRDLAWQVLLDCGINELPVDLNNIADYYGIQIQPFSFKNTDTRGGHTPDNKIILYSADSTEQQARFTIAHELGHILLEHNNFDGLIEREANSFSARLLMPIAVLHYCGISKPEDIAGACNVSIEAAQWRAKRLRVLIERNKFGTSDIERRLLAQFENYIKANRGKYA